MFDTFGNKVKIKPSPETLEKGFAGKIGEVFGQTTPSLMQVEIIGKPKKDFAVNIHFKDIGESYWFDEDLLAYIDNGEESVITLNGVDKKWIKGKNGEWIESKKEWWKFWK